MKILKLTFHNINNLKGGPHVIPFNALPLQTAGIFAITGPTGSGKSTILDVITLALFNRIPRFKKAISKGEMQGLGSILTHHTNEASASIEYEIKGRVYVSSWSVSKARTGNLKDYEMTLMDSTGTYLDLKRSEVPAKNEEIIGLKYDQFVKSIILSQGEFSKFLKADKNERGELLENLTGTSIYRKIGAKAFARYKEVNEAANLAKTRLEDIQVLTAEERTAVEESIEDTKNQLAVLDKKLAEQGALEQVKRELESIEKDLIANTEEQKRLSADEEKLKPDLDRLRLHEKLSPAAGDLELYNQARKDLEDSKQLIRQQEQLRDQLTTKRKELLNQLTKFTGKESTPEQFNEALNAFEQEVLALDRQKAENIQKGRDQRRQINQIKADLDLPLADKVPADEALVQLHENKATLTQSLKLAGLQPESDPRVVKTSLKTQRAQHDLLKEISQSLHSISDTKATIAHQQKVLSEIEQELTQISPLEEKSSRLLAELREKEALLLQQKEDALKIASLEELRVDLKDGKPCPLCGATDHPFSVHLPDDIRPELDTKLQETRATLTKEDSELKKLSARLTQTQTRKNTTAEGLNELNKKLEEQESLQAQVNAKYNGEEELTLVNLNEKLPQLRKSSDLLEEGITALEQIKINAMLITAFKEFSEIMGDYQQIEQQRKRKFTGENIVETCKKLRDGFANASTQITETNAALSFERNRQVQAQKQEGNISIKLKPLLDQHGFSSIEAMNAGLLSEDVAQDIRTQRDKLINQQTSNKANHESLLKRKATQRKLDTKPELSLDSLVTEKNALKEKRDALAMQQGSNTEKIEQDNKARQLLATKAEDLEKLNKEVHKWGLLNKMIGDSYGNKFSNFAQGLTLQNLLVYTNRRLTKLSDRYLLDKPTDDGALKVIDQYQGNSERSVSTLSGGETFLISLALALSLSDMASKNVSLDSLFIDEGFGTLDQETLDIAMTTLERLQSESQKTVGVISHVEALKERINVQIKLEKNAQGYSSIKIE
jgi:exonuclease SbcC